MNFVSERRDRWGLPTVFLLLTLACVALLAVAARAKAAETIYWDNYDGVPDSVAFASIDGSGGGALNPAGATEFEDPEGMAYDPVTNRLYVANEGGPGKGQITYFNLDGSSAGTFSAPGAPVEEPEGVAIDPVTRTIYWINTTPKTISWARLDGSAGGTVNLTGATLQGAFRLAIDTVGGKLYWGNNIAGVGSVSFASVNNSGGGNLNITGATTPESIEGIAVDPAGGRVYWLDDGGKRVSFASLVGGGGGDVNMTGAAFKGPYGLAFDPSLGKLYWANYGNGEERTGAIGTALIGGGGGGINIASAPVAGPQDPVILKSPTGTEAPKVTRSKNSRSVLDCSQGGWGADFPGSFVYQSPRSFAYQWTRGGKAISGATGTSLSTKSAGSYVCIVAAANQAGSASQTSGVVKVKAAKLKLTVKKKVKAKAGGVATFNIKAVNQGDLKSKSSRICVKVPKKAKKALKAPKCKSLGQLKGRGKHPAKLKIKVGDSASGTYKVTFVVRGGSGKSAKAKIQVIGAK